MTMIIWAYIFIGLVAGGSTLVWKFMSSSSSVIRGDDLFMALVLLIFWPLAGICFIFHLLGKFFSHENVIFRRKK